VGQPQGGSTPGSQDQPSQPQSASLVDLLLSLPWPVYAGAAVFILVILIFALRPRHSDVAQTNAGDRTAPAPPANISPTIAPSVPPQQIPPASTTIPPNIATGGVNLADLVTNAAPGGTVTVPAGLYPGGLIVTKAVRIVADPQAMGQVFIQSEGKECLTVRSKGVAVQGIQFMCNGIGELAAVMVTDGAELEMEGCKVQSMTSLGVSVVSNGSIKASGSGFNATKGTAVRVSNKSQGTFNQSSFSEAQTGLALTNGAKAELHSCAFERIGTMQSGGAIIAVTGEGTQLTGDDCHFTGNSVGVNVNEKGSITVTKSEFKDNNGLAGQGSANAGVFVVRSGGHAVVQNSTLTNSSPYALNVMGGATLALEDTEVTGSRTVGLVIGDRTSPGAHADVKRCHFARNATGIGVYAGGTADAEDTECRENNQGIVAFDPGTKVKLTKVSLIGNRDRGIYAYSNAEVTAVDSKIQNNMRGAQSGTSKKPAQKAFIRLQNCQFGGNTVFAVGAYVQSQLLVSNCVFDGSDKSNIYQEKGAIVQSDTVATGPETNESDDSGESPEASPDASAAKVKRKADKHRRPSDDMPRIIRRFLPNQ
jgi:hypothetical protein